MAPEVDVLIDEVRRAQLPSPRQRRQLREAARLSLREAADALGVSPMTVHRWEAGTVQPSRRSAIRYRELLDALDEALRAA